MPIRIQVKSNQYEVTLQQQHLEGCLLQWQQVQGQDLQSTSSSSPSSKFSIYNIGSFSSIIFLQIMKIIEIFGD